MENLLLIIFIVSGTIILFYGIKKLKFRYLVLSALSGLASFFAADFVCSFFSVHMPVNVFSLTVSALGGIPGVILLNLMNALLL